MVISREWIIRNWRDLPPSSITSAIADELGTGTNILSHSDVIAHFADINELDTKNWVYKKEFIITKFP